MRLGYRLLFLASFFILSSSSARAQWLYATRFPGDCHVEFDATILQGPYTIALHAPDHANATGVSFRLIVDGLGNEDDVVVTPQAGVTFLGDIRSGMSVSFSPRPLTHAPLMSLSFVDNAPPSPLFGSWIFASVRDAVLTVPGGPLAMEDMDAFRVHCNGSGVVQFRPPTVPEVTVGSTTIVEFKGLSVSDYYGPGPTNLHASDSAGWVVSMTPTLLWNSACAECPWYWETMSLTAVVPSNAAPGTQSLVTIYDGNVSLTTFSLTAIAPTRTESTTWGAIKALYR